jgi:hypothetical protein
MLRALGYRSDVHIYVASGEIYGGEDTLASLKALFPNFHTKETLSSQEELAPFLKFSWLQLISLSVMKVMLLWLTTLVTWPKFWLDKGNASFETVLMFICC